MGSGWLFIMALEISRTCSGVVMITYSSCVLKILGEKMEVGGEGSVDAGVALELSSISFY
jgi:hypothetical protein